jgi:hypothetical protein
MPPKKKTTLPTVTLPVTPKTIILKTDNTDYKFYVLNILHDLVHDYYDKKDRMKAFKELNDAIKTRFPTQIGGSETLTMPAETQVSPEPKLVLRLVYDEVEANGRKYIDTVFYELQFYYIGFTYVYVNEEEWFDFTKNTEAFMSLAKKNPNSLEEVMYNAFVTRCYNKFKSYKTLASLSSITSRDVVKDIRKFYSECFKECSKEQFGGTKDDDKDKLTENELTAANPLILSIVKNMKKKLVDDVTEEEKNQNLFLKVQSDIIDNFIINQGSNYDEDLYDGIKLISAAFAQNLQRNSSIIRSGIFSRYSQPKYEDIFDIIDNSNSYDMYRGNVLCPIATSMDGIVEFKNHACHDAASEETGETDIMLNVSDNQYVRLVRIENYGLQVIIRNGDEQFSSEKYEQDTIIAANVYKELIGDLNKANKVDSIYLTAYERLAIKSLGDIMQEWTATLKNGGYIDGPSYIPEARNIPKYQNGNAQRVLINNDRPSACRSLWILNNGKNRGASKWSNNINTKTAAGYAHNATNYFMHDFGTDTIYIHNEEEPILRRDTFSTSFTYGTKTLSLYVATNTYDSINKFIKDEIVYDILNKLLKSGPINVTDDRESKDTGLNFIHTIPQGTKFKLIDVDNDDYMPYPTDLNLRNTKGIPTITGRVNDVFGYITRVERAAFTNESRKMTQMINSELIYGLPQKEFGKFVKRKIVYVILPQQTQTYQQYGAGYQTGGMWQKGGFFMICS